MSNGWYKPGAEAVLNKLVDFDSDTFRIYFLDTGAYTANFNTDDFLDDIPGGALIGNGTLASLSITGGVFNAADLTINCGSATSVEAMVLVLWTGSAATSRLLFYWNSGTGLPFTPAAGGNVTVKWSTAGEILHLTIAA